MREERQAQANRFRRISLSTQKAPEPIPERLQRASGIHSVSRLRLIAALLSRGSREQHHPPVMPRQRPNHTPHQPGPTHSTRHIQIRGIPAKMPRTAFPRLRDRVDDHRNLAASAHLEDLRSHEARLSLSRARVRALRRVRVPGALGPLTGKQSATTYETSLCDGPGASWKRRRKNVTTSDQP